MKSHSLICQTRQEAAEKTCWLQSQAVT